MINDKMGFHPLIQSVDLERCHRLWHPVECQGRPKTVNVRFNSRISAYSTSALPFVNMDPSKLSTMYTCILHAAEQHNKCGQSYITVTFAYPSTCKDKRDGSG